MVVTPEVKEEKKDLGKKADSEPFGRTSLNGNDPVSVTGIKMHCKDTNYQHKDYEPDDKPEPDDEHIHCQCKCRLTEVDIEVKLLITTNTKKIEKGWFNLKTKDAYTGDKAKNGRHPPARGSALGALRGDLGSGFAHRSHSASNPGRELSPTQRSPR